MPVFFKLSSKEMLVHSRCDEEIYDRLLLRVCLKLSWGGVSLVVMTWVSANFGNWVHPAGGETSFQLADLTTWILTQKNLGSFNQCPTGCTPNSCFWPSTMIRIQKIGFRKIIEILTLKSKKTYVHCALLISKENSNVTSITLLDIKVTVD